MRIVEKCLRGRAIKALLKKATGYAKSCLEAPRRELTPLERTLLHLQRRRLADISRLTWQDAITPRSYGPYTPEERFNAGIRYLTPEYKLELAERLLNAGSHADSQSVLDDYWVLGNGYQELLDNYKHYWSYPLLEKAIMESRRTGLMPASRRANYVER